MSRDGVLVVVAFPGHEADKGVLAQADLAVLGGRTVGNDVAGLDVLADFDDRALVDAGALVGAHELDELIGIGRAVGAADDDLVGVDRFDNAAARGQHADAGVGGGLVLHAGGDNRLLGNHEGHGLALHVGAHQRAVAVVVFKERDGRGSDRNHHTRGDVHEIDHLTREFLDVVAVAAGHARTHEAVVLVQRFVGLGDDVLVLDISRHIHDFVGDGAGFLVDLAVRRFDKAVLVDLGEGGQIRDQADVGTFGRLDRAQAAIVGIVNVADLHARAVTGQTAGPRADRRRLWVSSARGLFWSMN